MEPPGQAWHDIMVRGTGVGTSDQRGTTKEGLATGYDAYESGHEEVYPNGTRCILCGRDVVSFK